MIISGVIVGPLWLGLVGGVSIFIEEVLSHKERYEGPDWIPQAIAIAIFGTGFFLWKVVGGLIGSRWGQSANHSKNIDEQSTE